MAHFKFQVALKGLDVDHAGCKLGSNMAKIGSTESMKEQKNTCNEEGDKSTVLSESELHLATVRYILFFRKSDCHCKYCLFAFLFFNIMKDSILIIVPTTYRIETRNRC